jgi:hypothetical protein
MGKDRRPSLSRTKAVKGRNVAESAQEGEADLSGWLQKHGGGVMKSWLNRYFQVSGHYLRYYDKEVAEIVDDGPMTQARPTVKGAYDLIDLESLELGNGGSLLVLLFNAKNTKDSSAQLELELKLPVQGGSRSGPTLEHWFNAMRKFSAKAVQRDVAGPSGARGGRNGNGNGNGLTFDARLPTATPLISGVLRKRCGRIVRTWRPRWFEISGGFLRYYDVGMEKVELPKGRNGRRQSRPANWKQWQPCAGAERKGVFNLETLMSLELDDNQLVLVFEEGGRLRGLQLRAEDNSAGASLDPWFDKLCQFCNIRGDGGREDQDPSSSLDDGETERAQAKSWGGPDGNTWRGGRPKSRRSATSFHGARADLRSVPASAIWPAQRSVLRAWCCWQSQTKSEKPSDFAEPLNPNPDGQQSDGGGADAYTSREAYTGASGVAGAAGRGPQRAAGPRDASRQSSQDGLDGAQDNATRR